MSGGTARPLGAWQELAVRLDVTPRLVDDERRWSLWGHTWLLPALLVMLTAEWVVRKRQGML